MAENEDNVLQGKRDRINISMSELREMMVAAVTAAVQQSSETSAKMIAEALIESKKPYIDPRQAENEANMRKSMHEVHERIQRDIKASQDSCSHLQGANSLSDYPRQFNLTAIVQHKTDVGEIIGICTNCQRIFRQGDPDYIEQMFKRKSGNRMSQAGQRTFINPYDVERIKRTQ